MSLVPSELPYPSFERIDFIGWPAEWPEGEVRLVPMDLVRGDQTFVREEFVELVKRDWMNGGLKERPVLLEHEGVFLVLDGNHRLNALMELGETQIEARVVRLDLRRKN